MPHTAPSAVRAAVEAERLDADGRLLRLTCLVMLIPASLYVVNDVLIAGNGVAVLTPFVAVRAIIIGTLLYGAVRIARLRDRVTYERQLTLALVVLAASLVALRSLRPPENLQSTYFELLSVLVMYAAFPLPAARLQMVNGAFTAALLAINLFWAVGISLAGQLSIVGALVVANVLGWMIAHNRRTLLDSVSEARIAAAEANAELRTLRGIIPVCAGCSQVRTDDNTWQQLQSYVAAHTDAEFSHGLCPDCSQALYPEFSTTGSWRTPER